MTNTLRNEPYLVSQLVRIAVSAITLRGIEELINWRPLNSDQLNELAEIVELLRIKDGFHRAMLVERAGGLFIFESNPDELETLGLPVSGKGTLRQAVWGLARMSGYIGMDQRLTMDAYDKILVVSTNLNASSIEAISSIMDSTMKEARRFPPKLFTRLLFPALGKSAGKFLQIEAERRLVAITLAVEQFRLKNGGALPQSIAELTESIPVDEITKAFGTIAIQNHPQDDGHLLYMIGMSFMNNRGEPTGTGTDVSLKITHRHEAPKK